MAFSDRMKLPGVPPRRDRAFWRRRIKSIKGGMSKAQFAEKIAVHVSTINTWDEDHPPKGGIFAATVRARRLLEGKKSWKLDVQTDMGSLSTASIEWFSKSRVNRFVIEFMNRWTKVFRTQKSGIP